MGVFVLFCFVVIMVGCSDTLIKYYFFFIEHQWLNTFSFWGSKILLLHLLVLLSTWCLWSLSYWHCHLGMTHQSYAIYVIFFYIKPTLQIKNIFSINTWKCGISISNWHILLHYYWYLRINIYVSCVLSYHELI